MYASQTVQYQALSSSNLMLGSPCWNPASVATRSKQLWRAPFDDLGRASIRSILPRPKRRHEPSAWRALRDWESTKFPESWLICKLPASQLRMDFNLRPTISATSRDLASISSIPGPATNDGEHCGRLLVFATSAPPPAASIAQSALRAPAPRARDIGPDQRERPEREAADQRDPARDRHGLRLRVPARLGDVARQPARDAEGARSRRRHPARSWRCSRRRSVWIRRSHRDERMLLCAGLELFHHLQHRPEDPAVRDDLVLVLARIGVEVE
jgi:hypothetical protein